MKNTAGSADAVPGGEADPLGFAEQRVWTERMKACLTKGGPEGGKWYWLHDKVFSPKTLGRAYELVRQRKGAMTPGIDGVTVDTFGKRLAEEITRLAEAWKAETFRPQGIRRSYIPKPGSPEPRPLGIPTVRDRVVQTALKLVLEPIFEVTFHPRSYGFRPGRSAKDALTALNEALQSGLRHVVDADLKGYFDSIPHQAALDAVRERVTDRRILGLLEQYLKAGIWEGEELFEPEEGSPQGGVISPLLANIYLNDLDWQMARRGWQMYRYADDFVVLCDSQEEAAAALAYIREWTRQAGLTLHPDKTRLVDMRQNGSHFDFLGFRFKNHKNRKTGKDKILRLVRPKSVAKVRDNIRRLTPRQRSGSLEQIVSELNRTLKGWFQYFRSAHPGDHRDLDQFVRRRLRALLAKRHKRPCWGSGSCHTHWPNAFFDKAGLHSLEAYRNAYCQPC